MGQADFRGGVTRVSQVPLGGLCLFFLEMEESVLHEGTSSEEAGDTQERGPEREKDEEVETKRRRWGKKGAREEWEGGGPSSCQKSQAEFGSWFLCFIRMDLGNQPEWEIRSLLCRGHM